MDTLDSTGSLPGMQATVTGDDAQNADIDITENTSSILKNGTDSLPARLEPASDHNKPVIIPVPTSDHNVPADTHYMSSTCTTQDTIIHHNVPTDKPNVPTPEHEATPPFAISQSETNGTQCRYIIVDHDNSPVNSERDCTLLDQVDANAASKVTLPPLLSTDDWMVESVCRSPSGWSQCSSLSNDHLVSVSPYAYAQSPGDSCTESPRNLPDMDGTEHMGRTDTELTGITSGSELVDSKFHTKCKDSICYAEQLVGKRCKEITDCKCSMELTDMSGSESTDDECVTSPSPLNGMISTDKAVNCHAMEGSHVSQELIEVECDLDNKDMCSSVVTVNCVNETDVDEQLEHRPCEANDEFSRDKDMAYLLSENDHFFQEIDKVLRSKCEAVDKNKTAGSGSEESNKTHALCEVGNNINNFSRYLGQQFSNQQDTSTLETRCFGNAVATTGIGVCSCDSVLDSSSGENPSVTALDNSRVPRNSVDLQCREEMSNAATLDNDLDDVRRISPEIICMTHLSPSDIYGKETTLGVPRLISRQSTDSSLNTPDPIVYADSDSGSITPMLPTTESHSCFIPIEPNQPGSTSFECLNNNVSCKRKLDHANVADNNGNYSTTSEQQYLHHPTSTANYNFMNQMNQYNGRPPDISTWTAVSSHPGPGKYGSSLQHGYTSGYPSMMGDQNAYAGCMQQFGYPGCLEQPDMAGQFSNKPTCTVLPYISGHYNPSVASQCNTYVGSQYRNAQSIHPFLNPPQGNMYTNQGIPYTESPRYSCQFAGYQGGTGEHVRQARVPGPAVCRLDFSSPAISPSENYQQNLSFPVPNFISKPYIKNLSHPNPVLPTSEQTNACLYPDNMNRYTHCNRDMNNNAYLSAPVNNKDATGEQCFGTTATMTLPTTTRAFSVTAATCPTPLGLYSPSVDTDIADSSDNEVAEHVTAHRDNETDTITPAGRLGWGSKQVLVPLTARNTQVFCTVAELGSRKVSDLIQSAENKESEGKAFSSTVSPPIAHTKLNRSFTKDFLQQRRTKSPSSAFCAVLDLSKEAERKRQKLSRGGNLPVIAQPPVAMPVQSLLNQTIPNVNFQGALLPYLASLYPAMSAASISSAELSTPGIPATHGTKYNYVPILPNNTRPQKACNSDTLVIQPPVALPVNIYNSTPYTAYISHLPNSLYSSVVHSGPVVTCTPASMSRLPVVNARATPQAGTVMATLQTSTQLPSNTQLPRNTQACQNAQAILNIQLANKQLNPLPSSLQCRPSSQAPWQMIAGAATALANTTASSDILKPYLTTSLGQLAPTVTRAGSKSSSSQPVPPATCAGVKPAPTRVRRISGRTATTSLSCSVSSRGVSSSVASKFPSSSPMLESANIAGRAAHKPGGDMPAEHAQTKVTTYYPVPSTKQLKKAPDGSRKTFKARHCYFTCLQIGTFHYTTRQINYERTARVKFLYSKRKLVYEFQLNTARPAWDSARDPAQDAAQRQLAEVEVPFESICALWLHGKEMRLQVATAPKMHLGARHWERSVRYGPHAPAVYNRCSDIDLTDGQLDDVPYHYVLFKTNCGDKMQEEMSQFDSHFADLLKLPLVVDPARTLRPPPTELVSAILDSPDRSPVSHHAVAGFTEVGSPGMVVSCQCTNGCSCQQCACCVRGVTCTEGECGCVDCRNPLNILHQLGLPAHLARTDPCLMENIYQVKKLDCYVKIEVRVECCDLPLQLLHCIPGTFPCPGTGCLAHYTYSWCLATLCNNETAPRNHCVKCGRCSDYRNRHCQTCNICYFAGESGSFKCPICHNCQDGDSVDMDSSTDSDV